MTAVFSIATLFPPHRLDATSTSFSEFQLHTFLKPCRTNHVVFCIPPRALQEAAHTSSSSVASSGNPSLLKMPTAPWMRTPLFLPEEEVADFSRRRKGEDKKEGAYLDISLTERVKGGRGKQAMRRIVRSISRLQKLQPKELTVSRRPEESPVEELGNLIEQIGDNVKKPRKKLPWARAEKIVFPRLKKEKAITAAELSLDGDELARLRREAAKMRRWIKVKKAGVTEDVVQEIRSRWRETALVMVKFDLPLCRNMERALEILETKTGGLVVWSKKNAHVVYGGLDFQPAPVGSSQSFSIACGNKELSISSSGSVDTGHVSNMEKDGSSVAVTGSLYVREGDRLLNGLGPRFIDWWGPKPLPVDADLLSEIILGFRPPFRLCPPHTRLQLKDDELTYLRKSARPLPTHFVLGRNSKLQGLASAILKLWEKSHIVKIAVKYGSPNTNNEKMAEELKRLTGGVLILRNKFYIIMYRGKDFLPCKVAKVIAEREKELRVQQLQEETSRRKAAESSQFIQQNLHLISTSGTFSEFQNLLAKVELPKDDNWEIKVQIEAEKEKLEKELKKQEFRFFILKLKIERSEKILTKLDTGWKRAEQSADQEILTEEEKQMFQKIGLKMDAVLVLGRRGIYDGVIESIHQHWKHREVVKVITMQRQLSHITSTARMLEIDSGGVLVSVDKLKRGHAIIIYRGKNFRRPLKLVTGNLLKKREALERSIEMQRRGSLKFFAYKGQLKIKELKRKLDGKKTWQHLLFFKKNRLS